MTWKGLLLPRNGLLQMISRIQNGDNAWWATAGNRGRLLAAWTLVIALGAVCDSARSRSPIFLFTFLLGAIPQWLLLRRLIPRAWPWLIMSPIAGIAGMVVWVWLGLMAGQIISHSGLPMPVRWTIGIPAFTFIGAVQGAVIGAVQWRVLRGLALKARRWIISSALAWGIAGLLVAVFWDLLIARALRLALGGSIGLVVGAITGFSLLGLLSNTDPRQGCSVL